MTSLLIDQKKNYQNAAKLTLFIVMGVSGSGKTVLGKRLAQGLSQQKCFEFLDADDFHTPEAKKRMAANLPLDDAMRKPWIDTIIQALNSKYKQNKNVVLAYSGLRFEQRKCFRTLGFQCHYYYLSADMSVIRSRMLNRQTHFFKAELLASQFSAMQEVQKEEHDITTIDVSGTEDETYQQLYTLARQALRKEQL